MNCKTRQTIIKKGFERKIIQSVNNNVCYSWIIYIPFICPF